MVRRQTAWLAVGLALFIGNAGCDQAVPTTPPATTVGVSPPPPPPPPPPPSADGGTTGTLEPITSPATPTTDPPASAPPTPATVGTAAFLAANREVLEISEQMRSALVSAVDDATAQQAAQKLPGLTQKWEVSQKGATALFLTLSKEQQSQVMLEGQREMLAKGKPMGEDLLTAIQRLAASPQRPIVHEAIVQLRDTMLAQHSIYAPVTFRQRLAEKLGATGSPLP